jgi:adenylylsulfate kinase
MIGARMEKSENVVWHHHIVTRQQREAMNGHRSFLLWFTGLSGAGKSTLANAVERELFQMGCHSYVLDGDNVRHGLCANLGFSEDDRKENIRRIGEAAKLFVDAGMIALTAFISPFRADRDRVRAMLPEGEFIEIYCKCSLEVCEQRDVKGLYAKARAGLIKNYTGISSPYEEPLRPEIEVPTDHENLDQSVQHVLGYLRERGLIR